MNTTTTTTETYYHPGYDMAGHFRATQHEDTRIVIDGLCSLVHEPHTIKSRERYAWHLRERISRVIEQMQHNGQPTTYDPQIIDLLKATRDSIRPEGTKAENGMRVRQTLRKIEGILIDDVDACTCRKTPDLLCFGSYHLN